MTASCKTWVAMAVATSHKQLTGIAGFIASRDDDDRWRFCRFTESIKSGDKPDLMLERIADHLPPNATLLGWNVDQRLVPLLLDAAATVAPEIAHHFTARLYRLLRGGVMDLAIGSTLEDAPLPMSVDNAALALWRNFVRSAGVAGIEAEAATDAWLKRRATIRAIRG